MLETITQPVVAAASHVHPVNADALDLPAWIQAFSSIIAVLAVATVAWIEHRRARKAERRAEALATAADVQFLTTCLTLAKRQTTEHGATLHMLTLPGANGGIYKVCHKMACRQTDRAIRILERLLLGPTLRVDSLLVGEECLETWRTAAQPLENDQGVWPSLTTSAAVVGGSVVFLSKLEVLIEHAITSAQSGQNFNSLEALKDPVFIADAEKRYLANVAALKA